MTERDYVISTFQQNFSSFHNKKIALYGLGNQTKIILEEFPDYIFSALLDGYQDNGTVYNKSVITMEKLMDLGIEIIIIVARAASVKVIYKRISQFCNDNKINVYDMNGIELSQADNTVRNSKHEHDFNLSKEAVKSEIRKHDIISFDIFDTLLIRKVLDSADIFRIVQNRCNMQKIDFINERIIVERDLAENCPSLFDIYNEIRIRSNITEQEVEKLMYQEIEVELEIMTSRKAVKELLEYALSINKRVYLISDMYLSKAIITNLLEHNGIFDYEDLFISCEYHTGKRQQLFQEYKKKVKGKSYLHIGDDEDADGISAKLNNIDFIIIDKAKDLLEKSTYGYLLAEKSYFEGNVALGLMAADVFNDPFILYHTDGRPSIQSAYQLGYTYIAPVISNYVIWLIENLKSKDFTEILFIARDGYLIKQLYDMAIQILDIRNTLPKSIYFLTSRLAGISATADTDEIIEYASMLPFNGTPEEILRKRFLLRNNEVKDYDEIISIKDYIILHSDKIKKSAETLRINYEKYISGLSLTKNGRIALFDFVSSGTCHVCIEDIMKRKLEGFYFIHLMDGSPKKQQLKINSYYNNSFIYEQNNSIIRNYYLLESIIKASEPSISHFTIEGEPIFLPKTNTGYRNKYIKEIQNGIINYFYKYISLVKDKNICSVPGNAERCFNLLQEKYSVIEKLELKEFIIRDEFCNRSINLSSFF